MNISFDESRALEILGLIDREWSNETGIFQGVVLPQNRWELPCSDPKEVALFLFYAAIFMRGGIVSEEPFRLLLQLKQDNPEFFDPGYVAKKLNPKAIEETIRKTRIPSPNDGPPSSPNPYKLGEHSRSWHHNSVFLSSFFLGNPLLIFSETTDFEEAFARIDRKRKENGGWGIMGMRRKIFSLYVIWLQERDLIPCYPMPIPIDFHAMRILWATEIMDFKGLRVLKPSKRYSPSLIGKRAVRITEKIVDEIALWTGDFLDREGISHEHINPALWTLSRDLCPKSYPNSSVKREGEIILREPELLESPQAWPRKYKDPCSICTVEEYCHGAIPAAPYYKWGLLLKMSRSRYQPLQPLLPHINPKELLQKINGRTRA